MKSKASLVLIIIFSVFASAIICGYVFLKILTSDEAIKTKITKALKDHIDGELNIGSTHFDLFKGLVIDKIEFKGPANLRINAKKIIVRHEPLALLRGKILINSATIISPEIFAIRDKDVVWKYLFGIKSFLDKAKIESPTDHLRSGITVKDANIHIFDETVFRNGQLNIENMDMVLKPFGGSLRDVNIKGSINDGYWEGFEFTANANFTTPELKIVAQLRDKFMNEDLMKEVPGVGEKLWKAYLPTGRFNMSCILNFNGKNNERKKDYDLVVDITDAEMTYIKWPILVKHVNGIIEFSRDGIYLRSLKGNVQNEGQEPLGEIDAFFGTGNAEKNIKLRISDINVTETLMKIIPNSGEKFWADYGPKGNIDMSLTYKSNEDKSETAYTIEAICKGVEAKLPNYPFRMSNIAGLIKTDGENVYFENMSGNLLNETKSNHTTFNGVVDLKSNESKFTVSIPNLDLTEKLIKSIPEKGEDIWSKYKPAGQVNLKIDYTGNGDGSKDIYLITLDCMGSSIEYTKSQIVVSDIIGRILIDNNNAQFKNLRGFVVSDKQSSRTIFNGVLDFKNNNKKLAFSVFDLKVIDNLLDKLPELFKKGWVRVKTGGWMDLSLNFESSNSGPEGSYSIVVDAKGCRIGFLNCPVDISDIDARVNVERGVLVSRNFKGICSGGKINGSIEIGNMSLDGEYTGELEFSGLNVKRLAEKLYGIPQELSGTCEGNINFHGKGTSIDDLIAEGRIRLREGYIAKVPVLMSILKLLNLSIPMKETFHSANIKYSVKDKVVNIEELEVLSDTIELVCLGTIGIDGPLNLTVVIGFNKETFSQIPLIGHLMDYVVGGVRKKLTKVKITGTFSNPQTSMVALTPFTHPIKSIFGLLARNKEHNEEKEKQNEDINMEK